jgi:hypothetical protein
MIKKNLISKADVENMFAAVEPSAERMKEMGFYSEADTLTHCRAFILGIEP